MSPRAADPEKRHSILKAALELFVQRGFHGTAVPEIAREAGVGAGTIYRYFSNKEALVNELYRHWKTELSGRLLDNFPMTAPPREQFKTYWNRYVDFAREFPRAQAFLELHHRAHFLDAESIALEDRLHEVARMVVGRMASQGAIRPAPLEVVLAVVFGAMLGVIKSGWYGHLELTDEVRAIAEQCCWEAIRA